jgi:ATP-dependent helicase/nuclease subunit A
VILPQGEGEREKYAVEAIFETLRSVFLTLKNTLLVRKPGKEQDKRLGAEASARYLELHHRLGEQVQTATHRLAEQRALRLNRLGLVAGETLLEAYQNLKIERGGLDFGDAELEAARLLEDVAAAGAVLMKLDARWKHLLLDEFQDTNPLQWRILKSWLSAYGADGSRPSVFLVGDPKQSIYRFRRAEPRLFATVTRDLEERHGATLYRQDVTRRCAPRLVAWINALFGDLGAVYPGYPEHQAQQTALAGHCEVLTAQAAEAPTAPTPWRDPLRQPAYEAPERRAVEAEQVAARIRQIVGRMWIADDGGRPARYADILVLSASRTGLEAFEDAFKAAGIAYVSSRRGGLLDTLEIADLRALLGVLVTPAANLYLAHALKSPLFGFTDDDLKTLAGRYESTWLERLQAWAVEPGAAAPVARAAGLLAEWRQAAGHLPPHDLLDRIFHAGEVEQRYAAATPAHLRAGVLANLRAFLELSLKLAGARYPSLPRFLDEVAALARHGGQESPDEAPAAAGDAVRMLTIHGAKGLEAPIVFLIKTDEQRQDRDHYGALIDWPPEARRPTHFSLYGAGARRGKGRAELFDKERQLAEREDLNLLYVAMTRARQALFASGLATTDETTWLRRLSTAFDSLELDTLPSITWQEAPPVDTPSTGTAAPMPAVAPVGSRRPPLSEEARFGVLVHRYLELATAGLTEAEISRQMAPEATDLGAIRHAARACLDNPELARFFLASAHVRARNELEYVNAAGERRRIDRLVEFPDALWILDYKTGGLSEADLSRRAAPYLEQLGEYLRAMAALYPGKPVRAGLVFTDGRFWAMPEG